jgi:hypothetical protein
MAENEVLVRVVQKAEGTALRDAAHDMDQLEQKQQKIAQLRTSANAYEDRGMPEAARTARIEANAMERELRRAARERTRNTPPAEQQDAHVAAFQAHQVETERKATQQMHEDQLRALKLRADGNIKEAQALERTNAIRQRAVELERRLGYERGQAVEKATEEVDAQLKISQQKQSGGLVGNIMRHLGLGGGIVGAVFAGLRAQSFVTDRGNSLMDEALQSRNAGVDFGTERRHMKFAMGTATGADQQSGLGRGVEDSLDALRKERDAQQTEIDKARNAQTTRNNSSWIAGPLGRGATFLYDKFYANPALAEKEGRRDQTDFQIQEKEKQKAEIERRRKEELEREVGLTERLAAGDMSGARSLEAKMKYHAEINRLKGMGASADEQVRGADAKFALEMRQHEQAMAGLITARTGAGSAARIASLADRQFAGVRGAVGEQRESEMKALHMTVKNQHVEAKANAAWSDLFTPKLRPGS